MKTVVIIKGDLKLGEGTIIHHGNFAFGDEAKKEIEAIDLSEWNHLIFNGDVTCNGSLSVSFDKLLVEGNITMHIGY